MYKAYNCLKMPLRVQVKSSFNFLTNRIVKLISVHPLATLSAILFVTALTIGIALLSSELPSFDDPLIGFEARGTDLAQKINTWKLITGVHHTKKSELTLFPYAHKHKDINIKKVNVPLNLEDDEEEQEKLRLLAGHKVSRKLKKSNGTSEQTFCPRLDDQYIHFVIKSRTDDDLLKLSNLLAICELDESLRLTRVDDGLLDEVCETGSGELCCYSWSLPNLIALNANKTNCRSITESDVVEFKTLLDVCASVYHQKLLHSDCISELCPKAAAKCYEKGNIVYNVMQYLVQRNFMVNPKSPSIVTHSNIFLPIARSASNIDYYSKLIDSNALDNSFISVEAAELGMKQALFEHLLLQDSWLVAIAFLIVLSIIYLFTKSILVLLTSCFSIAIALGLSFTMYTYFYDIRYFPFMNMMTFIILIGVGVDNIFVCCKSWQVVQSKLENESTNVLVRDTFKHSFMSMFATSVTTAVALLSNYSSNISATRCFSLFASTAVMLNFAIESLLLPCALVLDHKLFSKPRNYSANSSKSSKSSKKLLRFVFRSIMFLRHFILLLVILLTLVSTYTVIYKIKLPESQQLKTFKAEHLFEKYDSTFKNMFAFGNRYSDSDAETFPFSVIFGVIPADSGSYTNPFDRGTLLFDPKFDIASQESQRWLLGFCQKVRNSSFYKPVSGPLLGNCFIDTLKGWIEDRACDDNITMISNEPCCKNEEFPFKKATFNKCLRDAVELLHRTPTYVVSQYSPGPRFNKLNSKVLVAVIEYHTNFKLSSTYEGMSSVVGQIDIWLKDALSTAPEGLKSGFFVNDYLDLYALQEALFQGTQLSIPFALLWASIALVLVTRNLFLSVIALMTVMIIMVATIATLIQTGWELNIVESVVLSSAVGMAIDFPLHFVIAYQNTDNVC